MLKKMTPYLESVIRKVMREKNNKSPKFANSRDAVAWLKSQ